MNSRPVRMLFRVLSGLLFAFACVTYGTKEVASQPPTTVKDLLELRDFHDRTTWSKEVLAQKHEQVFVRLWDNLIHRRDNFQVLKEFQFDSIKLGADLAEQELDWDIKRKTYTSSRTLTREEALTLLSRLEANGYELTESEWHHSAFEPASGGQPAKSTVSILLHIQNAKQNRRIIVRGDLGIEWKLGAEPAVARVDASNLYMLTRDGAPAFEVASVESFTMGKGGIKNPASIHPVMIHDLNQDGLPEIVIGGFNRVYWNRGDWNFEAKELCEFPTANVRAAAFADLNGDGIDDYLCFPIGGVPVLYRGTKHGLFSAPPASIGIRQVMTKPSSVTVGDVDGDGDLDVFMGQQKSSYSSGFIPTPYYDANDGYPFYLLLNDGTGKFRDGTLLAGLGAKRNRHVFSGTLVDLDDDRDLDLLLTNDFCGCDYYTNDGQGVFTDARELLKPTPHAFGMSHSFGDYNLDGLLDVIAIGMSSTTARRLEQMGLTREGFGDYDAKRPAMGYGNRLFLNTKDGLVQAPFNDSCARTGWSWGSTTLDFDNDGDQDLYIANGQTSGKTTKDYCTRFWCHDLYYKPGERPDAAVGELFKRMAPLFSGELVSWNGYEHNALLMNLTGEGFVNIGFLMGCAFEFDARVAVAADLDADGRVDLLVEHKDIRNNQRHLYLLKNNWQEQQHWLGVHLRGTPSTAAHNAKVTMTLDDGTTLLQHYLTGHSVWAQHPATVHFGLGDRKPKELTVTWSNGQQTSVSGAKLGMDRYHVISPE